MELLYTLLVLGLIFIPYALWKVRIFIRIVQDFSILDHEPTWTVLEYKNKFGDYNRWTDEFGGQDYDNGIYIDHKTGEYHDVNS